MTADVCVGLPRRPLERRVLISSFSLALLSPGRSSTKSSQSTSSARVLALVPNARSSVSVAIGVGVVDRGAVPVGAAEAVDANADGDMEVAAVEEEDQDDEGAGTDTAGVAEAAEDEGANEDCAFVVTAPPRGSGVRARARTNAVQGDVSSESVRDRLRAPAGLAPFFAA
jgi:hypothetical protein